MAENEGQKGRKKNFFERKRFINYQEPGGLNSESGSEGNKHISGPIAAVEDIERL